MPGLSSLSETGHMEIAAVPEGPVDVPLAVARLAGGDEPVPVWRNTLGGLTFRLGAGDGIRFVKWMPHGVPSLAGEVERLNWARSFTEVPRVLESGDDDDGSWMLTVGLPGHSAVDPRFTSDDRAPVWRLAPSAQDSDGCTTASRWTHVPTGGRRRRASPAPAKRA
jgi:aminoglycoside phosphotransferase